MFKDSPKGAVVFAAAAVFNNSGDHRGPRQKCIKRPVSKKKQVQKGY